MNVDLAYLGHSGIVESAAGGAALRFSPNLARERVSFDAALKRPIRFREAISALHEIVVGDLRFKRRDRAAYDLWKRAQAQDESRLRATIVAAETVKELALAEETSMPPGLEVDFEKYHRIYWTERRRWADELRRNDPDLFRSLVPCDPVVTVAPDSVFFECFSKDEASYGCLYVDREGFEPHEARLGTTNVDYSLALYGSFQRLRSYRATRLQVDPQGFEVRTEGRADYREEKIDLPGSWLRGFGQLQAAMALPSRTVELSIDAVYNVLAHLRRHREKEGPRALRFELSANGAASVVLEPWNLPVVSHGPMVEGKAEVIRVWGRRRLLVLARVLPLADRVTVRLLGSGLPSVWTVHMGELRLVLALSGWTANDWSGGANLSLLLGAEDEDLQLTHSLTELMRLRRTASVDELARATGASSTQLRASLQLLAQSGQLIFDFVEHKVRWRSVLPVALSEAIVGPEPVEVREGKKLIAAEQTTLVREEALDHGRRLQIAKVGSTACEAILDLDGAFVKAKCTCSYFRKYRLRGGPCRHLMALRARAMPAPSVPTFDELTKGWLFDP